jgi:hypothetical protein
LNVQIWYQETSTMQEFAPFTQALLGGGGGIARWPPDPGQSWIKNSLRWNFVCPRLENPQISHDYVWCWHLYDSDRLIRIFVVLSFLRAGVFDFRYYSRFMNIIKNNKHVITLRIILKLISIQISYKLLFCIRNNKITLV